MIIITWSVRVADSNRAEFRRAVERHLTLTREEPGNIYYNYFEDQMEPGTLFFYEEWRDQAAFDFHLTQPYCHEFIVKARKLSDGNSDVQMREVIAKKR